MAVEEGLFLLANPLCKFIILSCLARAQALYPLTICHLIVEGTHIHMIVVVDNPDDVYEFMRHFKTETAHRFNKILGREKRTVWCDGYDSPVVLTPLRALIAIAYLYSNPAKDNLEDSIDSYPAFSTWKMFQKGEHSKRYKWIHRYSYRPLSGNVQNIREYAKDAERIAAVDAPLQEFSIKPNAWMEAFGVSDPLEQQKTNNVLVARIRLLEQRARKKRDLTGKRILGREKLLSQPINIYYRPKRSGRRMWVLSEVRSVRVAFINFLKNLISEGKRVRALWKMGDFSSPYPLGLYPPSMPKLAEPIGIG